MENGHNFNFEGGKILSRISAWWFVSYSHHLYVDNEQKYWTMVLSNNSLNTRISNFQNSTQYHLLWLNEVLHMQYLDKNANSAGIHSAEIKDMARQVINKLETLSN